MEHILSSNKRTFKHAQFYTLAKLSKIKKSTKSIKKNKK